MPKRPDDPNRIAAVNCVAAIRCLLGSFPMEGVREPGWNLESFAEAFAALKTGQQELDTYIPIAICAGAIRWASHETGRSEMEILDELAANYGV